MKKFNWVTPDTEQDEWNSLVTLWAVLGLTAGHMGLLIHGVWIHASLWPQVQTISCQSPDIIYARIYQWHNKEKYVVPFFQTNSF